MKIFAHMVFWSIIVEKIKIYPCFIIHMFEALISVADKLL